MTRIFKIEPSHRRIISKTTLFKALTYIDKKASETPYLLMDKEQIKAKVDVIGSQIPNSKFFYAVKANPSIEVIRYMNKLGAGFEIASEGELALLETLDVAPERIITSNPMKTYKFLKMAKKYGLEYFAFDSHAEVDKIAEYLPGAKVYVRLTVPNEGSEWPLSRKFGVEVDVALELSLYAKERGLDPAGMTFHVGSQCTNMYNWNSALHKARELFEMADEYGIRFKMIDIGGGYPIKYIKDVVNISAIERNMAPLIKEKFPDDVEIFMEPGRSVVGDAGIFVARVTGKAKRGDENWLYIDVGVFNGLMESIGGIKYRYITEDTGASRSKKQWTITGPSCDSFDVIDRDVTLPEPEVGSYILILSAGAYTISYASEFNGFAIPKTILI